MKPRLTRNKIWVFENRSLAVSFANRCRKAHGIILGDDMKYWVVTMADFQRLTRVGYETAE